MMLELPLFYIYFSLAGTFSRAVRSTAGRPFSAVPQVLKLGLGSTSNELSEIKII